MCRAFPTTLKGPTTKYMNAEDALLAWEEKPKKR